MKLRLTLAGVALSASLLQAQDLVQELRPVGASAGLFFGGHVALEGTQVLARAQVSESVYAFDALSGAELWRIAGGNGNFGRALALQGGFAFIADVSAPGPAGSGNTGRVFAYDRITGAAAFALDAPGGLATQQFGYAMAADSGIVAVSDPYRTDPQTGYRGGVLLFDAASGAVLGALTSPDPGVFFGGSLDLQGDRLFVGAPGDLFPVSGGIDLAGRAYVYDISGPAVLLDSFSATSSAPNVGFQVQLTGDHYLANGRGFLTSSLVISNELRGPALPGGSVLLTGPSVLAAGGSLGSTVGGTEELLLIGGSDVSGLTVAAIEPETGKRLFELPDPGVAPINPSLPSLYGASIAADGGLVAIGSPREPAGAAQNVGAVWIFEIEPDYPLLAEDAPSATVTSTQGGLLRYLIRDEPAAAGDTYLLLASRSGTSPGLAIDGVLLPLNPDGVTTASFLQAGSGAFQNTIGTFGTPATELAEITVPPLLPVGLQLDFAFLVIEPSVPVVRAASNALSKTIVP